MAVKLSGKFVCPSTDCATPFLENVKVVCYPFSSSDIEVEKRVPGGFKTSTNHEKPIFLHIYIAGEYVNVLTQLYTLQPVWCVQFSELNSTVCTFL